MTPILLDIINAFYCGENLSNNNTLASFIDGNNTLLVGYKDKVYGVIDRKVGKLTYYIGWYGELYC